MSIENRVKQIIINLLGGAPIEKEISNGSTPESLGMDSLDEVELIMELEEEFEIEISDSDGESFKTVQDIIDYIGEK